MNERLKHRLPLSAFRSVLGEGFPTAGAAFVRPSTSVSRYGYRYVCVGLSYDDATMWHIPLPK